MERFEWDPRLETGFAQIDDQHQSLFKLANELQRAIGEHSDEPDAVADAVYGLIGYVVEHFRDEEALMAKMQYPGTGPHRSLHEQLSAETMGITARYFAGEDMTPSELAPLVCRWLTEHIPVHDVAVVAYMHSEPGVARMQMPPDQ